ncbi:LLM class flavin-dependent oxidoreductase [Streptomyces actinomycinicus]|uniref:LLM class flavin-dependent oxidoreductase n=1 Tax=Streptomyces actinomycinicus TaxID=1695166 RepID=A0A937EHM1_9ACTN|nr:MupA/Atu3671 family FMN-dependent luciferase-like monooxygenase [Streptomyces actinomycinicus]MBL1082688.1 LLM class flavin-dependent oxidoreductase [Streptomyces actinomycinicus]
MTQHPTPQDRPGESPGTSAGETPGERRARLAAGLRQRIAERHHPLSYPQQRLWFLHQLDPGSAVYVVPLTYRITGPLDRPALEHALTAVVERHEVLRSVFRPVDGVPRQFVRPAAPVPVELIDLSEAADPEAEADRLCADQARTVFDLESDLLLRPVLLRLAPQKHRLCLTLHHIACDGWSLNLLAGELAAFYAGFLHPGPHTDPPEPLPVQYRHVAAQQEELLTGEPLAALLDHWRGRLAGAPALATLPTDRPRPPVQSHRGGHVDLALPSDAVERAGELARAGGTTLFAVLLAAFAAVVHAHTGAEEVIVGSPVAGRPHADWQRLIGLFANTVVLRIGVHDDAPFRELVARAGTGTRAAVAHQDLPFERLVEELRPQRDPAYNPLFQLMFSYHEEAETGLVLPGCTVRMEPGDTATAKFDLTMSLTRRGERLRARLEYSSDLFDRRTIEAFGTHYRTFLTAAVADPDLPVGALPVLTPEEERHILTAWNPAPGPAPQPAPVHELVRLQARRTPDAVAVEAAAQDGGAPLTYRLLDRQSDELADRLRAAGVRADTPVGVCLDRSPQLVVALLAVLKAGGAYLPLDPAYPAQRLALMVEDSRTPIVLTRRGLVHRLPRTAAVPLLTDDPAPQDAQATAADREDPAPAGERLAYVIYTSGSTGRPKGVMVTHANLSWFLSAMDRRLGDAGPGATWLAVTSMSFDISVLELLWPLTRGHRIVVRGDEPTAVTAGTGGVAVTAADQTRAVGFSLFYFGGSPDHAGASAAYRLLLEGARFADANGFTAVWTPERHFHSFGGLYPNPAVTAAAVAAVTERVAVRAGSVVLPLHDTIRVAEEWAVVDHLSGGRAGISVASGWQPDDFVLAPDRYRDRKERMLQALTELRSLWRGGTVTRRNGIGKDSEVRIFPPPLQPDLPLWITSARSPETFRLAGEAGAGLLTHLLGHTADQLAEKVRLYRAAWREAGHPGDGHVSLMLHTFVGADTDAVRETVRAPLCAYIKSSFDLLSGLGEALGRETDPRLLPEAELDALVERAFERFFETSGLLGTPEHCADVVDRLKGVGVDEIACLIDFGVPPDEVLASLAFLPRVRELSEDRRRRARADEPIGRQLVRHGVTHLQCTPSLAGVLAADPGARDALAGLDRLLVGGEALAGPLARDLAELLPGRAYNMYGPTEATVWASAAAIDETGPVTIGTSLPAARAHVVDARLRPAPLGSPGELLLGGPGIVRGYLGRPALTAERFLPDPFAGDGGRLYRTGDLVRRRADGRLEFLGRLDQQVKLHGHRIEPGEIENVLREHPAVRAAAVTVLGEGNHARLVAYCAVATAAGRTPDTAELTAHTAGALPAHMVPAEIVLLDALPLTPNGKVDKAALPAPRPRGTTSGEPPGSDLERRIAEVLAGVLRVERLGVTDNFFERGGNSLLAVQARTRLQPVLGESLTLVDIFRHPTVRALATAFADATDGHAGTREALRDGARQHAARQARARSRHGKLRRERRDT